MLDFHSPRLKHTLFESVMPRHLILLIYLVVVSTILPFQPIHGQVRLTDAEYETYTDHLKQLNIQEVRTNFTSSYTLHVIKVWDSLNRNHHNVIYEKLPAKIWQDIFEKRYARSISNNDQALRLKIAYPLSFICHTRSSFNEGLPVLEFLYANKSKLNKKLYESVLIKLEEEYRFFNQMDGVLKIRNERIERGFIKTFWEIYYSCGLYEEAINDYKLFEPLPSEFSRKRLTYYLRLGDLFFEAKKIDSAEKYFKIGLKETELFLKKIALRQIQEEGNFVYWKGWFTGLIANCYMERGNYQAAKKMHLYFLSLSNGEYRLNSLLPLSICYIKTGELDQAKKSIDSVAYYIAGRTIGKVEIMFLKTKSDYFEARKQFDSALFYLQLHDQYNKAIIANISKNQSSLLTAKMEIEKRRKELVLTQNQLVAAKLSSSLREGQLYLSVAGLVLFLVIIILVLGNLRQKEKSRRLIEAKNHLLEIYAETNLQKSQYNEQLVKELHHRVKNNLQNIYSLLNIQKRRIEDKETIDFVSSIQNRINSMAIVHESLYAEGDIEMIDFKSYTIKLVDHIYQSFEKEEQQLKVNYNIDPVEITLEKIILIGLIINETVSNVFKHAINQRNVTTLTIQLYVNDTQATLIIQDDGPGFAIDDVKATSLGLKLIQTMCQQLEAEYTLVHQEGVIHKITFSI